MANDMKDGCGPVVGGNPFSIRTASSSKGLEIKYLRYQPCYEIYVYTIFL